MKNTVFVAVVVTLLCITASAAFAVLPYQVTVAPSGVGDWVYTLQNNTSNQYVVAWYLYWASPFYGTTDRALANANFIEGTNPYPTDPTSGYRGKPNSKWDFDYTYLNHPGFVTGNMPTDDRIAPGQTRTGFVVHYAGGAMPGKFMVLYTDSSGNEGPTLIEGGAAPVVPEPGSLVTLLSGLAGGVCALIRKRK